MSTLNRRAFIPAAGGAAGGLVAGRPLAAQARGVVEPPPKALGQGAAGEPLAVGSSNALAACARAVELLRDGADPVDAAVAGVNLVEDDPNDHSVGYGGLPNEDGVVELDASVMHGPTHRAGAVAALQRIKNPSSVAKMVARYTDHVLLVGAGALRFARALGFPEQELLTDEARQRWLEWKAKHSDGDDWLWPQSQPATGGSASGRCGFTYGTINLLVRTRANDLGGCTSTSGLSYKLAGRVGDSPIIGAGLYVDNEVGAAGSTGRGEANLQNCSCFLIVELMRAGMDPTQACLEALRRVARHTEPRLKNGAGEPAFALQFYALRRDGALGGAAMQSRAPAPARMALHDGREARLVELPALYPA